MAGLPGPSDYAEDGRGHDGHNTIRRIAVFCGASSGNSPEYTECAKKMGQEMVKRGIGLVYGGEHPHIAMKLNQSCPVVQCNLLRVSNNMENNVLCTVLAGGNVGLMGEIASTVYAGLGEENVIGVIPEALQPREVASCCQPVFPSLYLCGMGCSCSQIVLRHWCTSYNEGLLSTQRTEEPGTDRVT